MVVVWPMQSRDSRWVKALRERDFWFRYHAIDENFRLDDQHRFLLPWNDRFEFKLDAGPDARDRGSDLRPRIHGMRLGHRRTEMRQRGAYVRRSGSTAATARTIITLSGS
jgi:hypothetical protein